MKRKNLLSALIDTLLACLMAIAGVGCLATGFQMDVDMQIVMVTVLLCAGLACLCARIRKGWLVLLVTILVSLWLMRDLDFFYNYYSAIRQILTLYERGYGWSIPEFLLDYDDWDLTLTIASMGGLCALLAGYGLSACRHTTASLAVILPVLPCIVLTDTVPDGAYLLIAIIVLALLALTSQSRKMDTRQANRLTAMVLIPAVLASTLLFTQNAL